MSRVGIFLAALLLMLPFSAIGGEPFEMLSSARLKAAIELKPAGLVVIDSRSLDEFRAGHIPTAINIPLATLEQDTRLPAVPRDSRLVFYCSGST